VEWLNKAPFKPCQVPCPVANPWPLTGATIRSNRAVRRSAAEFLYAVLKMGLRLRGNDTVQLLYIYHCVAHTSGIREPGIKLRFGQSFFTMLSSNTNLAAIILALSIGVLQAIAATPQALNPQLTNTIPDVGGPVLYYNGSGPVPAYNLTSPAPAPITPLNRHVTLICSLETGPPD
jgi:hypothetical protein